MRLNALVHAFLWLVHIEASIWNSGVKGLRGLKKEEGKQKGNNGKQNDYNEIGREEPQQQGGKQQNQKNPQEEDRTFGSTSTPTQNESNQVLLSCLSEHSERNPSVSALGLVTCTDSLENVVVPITRRWDPLEATNTEELNELLGCLGESVGCQEEQADNTNSAYFDCLSSALQGEPTTFGSTSDPRNCLSLWDQPLQELLACIGDSVGCPVEDDDPAGEDRFDDPPLHNGPIPLPLPEGWDQDDPGLVFPLPEEEGDRNDDPPVRPIPIPLPEGWEDQAPQEGGEPGLVFPLPEGEDRNDDPPIPIPPLQDEPGLAFPEDDRGDGSNGSDVVPVGPSKGKGKGKGKDKEDNGVVDLLDRTSTLGYLYDNSGFP